MEEVTQKSGPNAVSESAQENAGNASVKLNFSTKFHSVIPCGGERKFYVVPAVVQSAELQKQNQSKEKINEHRKRTNSNPNYLRTQKMWKPGMSDRDFIFQSRGISKRIKIQSSFLVPSMQGEKISPSSESKGQTDTRFEFNIGLKIISSRNFLKRWKANQFSRYGNEKSVPDAKLTLTIEKPSPLCPRKKFFIFSPFI